MKNILIAFLLLITSCSGDKKPAPVTESAANAPLSAAEAARVEELIQNLSSKIPSAIETSYWPRNGYMPTENLAFGEKYKIHSESAGSGADTGANITSSPIFAEDKIITIGGRGELQARSSKDISKKLWQTNIDESGEIEKAGYLGKVTDMFKSKGEFLGANIGYSLGKVFVSTRRGNLFAVNAADGKILWSKNYGAAIRSAPVAREETVAFVTADSRTIAVDVNDGTVKWQHQGTVQNSRVYSSPTPALVEDQLIVTYSASEIFSLSFQTGAVLWSSEDNSNGFAKAGSFLNDVSQSPAVNNGRIFITFGDGSLICLNMQGALLWKFKDDMVAKTVWPVGEYVFATTKNNSLIALSADAGKLLWRAKLADKDDVEEDNLQYSGVVMANGKLFAVNNKGSLYSYSAQDGSVLNKTSVTGDIYQTPVVADKKIYLISRDAELVEVE